MYLILTSQTSTRGPIVGHEAQNLDAQRVLLNTFENIINRRVDIPEDIQRFQKTSVCLLEYQPFVPSAPSMSQESFNIEMVGNSIKTLLILRTNIMKSNGNIKMLATNYYMHLQVQVLLV